MENDQSKLLLGFLLGAAAGAFAGYLMAGGKKEDLITDVKSAAGKIKEEVDRQFRKGEELLDELAKSTGDLFNESK